VRRINRTFESIRKHYARRLKASLDFLPVTVVFAACVLASIYFLYTGSKQELAPQEDQGVIITTATGAPDSTLDQRRPYTYQMYEIFDRYPQMEHLFQMDVPGKIISGMVLVPWDQRTETASELQPQVQQDLNAVAGLQVAAFQPPSLPGSSGLPVQFVITTTLPFDQLNTVSQDFLQEALKSGYFAFLNTNLRIDLPQSTLEIDRDKAAVLGLSMQDVGDALSSMLGGGYVNYFSMSGRSYKVIPQSQQRFRLNADQLLDYQIRTESGTSVPISTFATISTKTTPESLNHFQQLNAATIEGVPAPGVSTGEALNYLNELKNSTLPFGYAVDYAGPSRQYMYETSGFVSLFGFALIIIFLALAAKFESFRDPLVILVSVPMSIAGALIFISLGVGGSSLNIYTQVGLVTLMGLISKHGILIVEFANNLQKQGVAKRQAIEQAAEIRLRPILMTTAAMVLGVVPLLTASGAGAEARFNLGLVIASGLTIGTAITLFIVPAVYMLVGADHSGEPSEPDNPPA
jgi:multidrug efflux pump